jgi:hypothetical protein
LERHFPLADEIEPVGLFTLMENVVPSLKADIGGTAGYNLDVMSRQVNEKRMRT